jgi:predicted ferric reductase
MFGKNEQKKRFPGIGFIAVGLLFMIMAASVPFLFESPSLYYKLGVDRVWLRTGKVIGLLGAMLIFFQVLFISRLSLLENSFSRKKLYGIHRFNGKIILILVLLHPFFIVAAENFTLFSLEKRYWPEFVGVGLLALILIIVVASVWRVRLGVSHKAWRLQHQWGTMAVFVLLFTHILFVSESFDARIPLAGVTIAGIGVFLLFTRIYYKRFFKR